MSAQRRGADGPASERRRRPLPVLLGLGAGVGLLHAVLIDAVDRPNAQATPAPRMVAVWLAPQPRAGAPAPRNDLSKAPMPETAAELAPAPAANRAAEVPKPRPRPPRPTPRVAAAPPPPGPSMLAVSTLHPAADRGSLVAAVIETPPDPAPEGVAGAGVEAPVGVGDGDGAELPDRLAAADAASGAIAGAASASPKAAAPTVPTYPTTLPPAFRHGYDMRRGLLSGQGELVLQRLPSGYEARLEGRIAGFTILDWRSRGHLDADGFAPDRFLDERRGRAPQAANFRREGGGGPPRITYSGPSTVNPLPAGTQDRLSWMLQLAAIAQARPPRPGETIEMFVSGARGDADVWSFRVTGIEPVTTPAGRADALHLVRAPRADHDTRAEVWLDPARHHLPVRARLSTRADGSDALELELRDIGPP